MRTTPPVRDPNGETPSVAATWLAPSVSTWLATSFAEPVGSGRKLLLLRIGVALPLAWRWWWLARDARHYFASDTAFEAFGLPWQAAAAWLLFLASVALAFGWLPRAGAACLVATIPAYGYATTTDHLGMTTSVPMLATLVILGGGAWRPGTRRAGPKLADARLVAGIAFVQYALLHFAACRLHVADPIWRDGEILTRVLTNSYLSRFYEAFRWWVEASPETFGLVCLVGAGSQIAFQVFMIPAAVTRLGRLLVIVWGSTFFLISAVALHLTILPVLELVFWAWLFVPSAWLAGSPRHAPLAATRPAGVSTRTKALVVIPLAALTLFVATEAGTIARPTAGRPAWATTVCYLSGLVSLDIFNRVDATMGDQWARVMRADPTGGPPTLVPFVGHDGQRLAMHRSDLVIYANSMPWRRSVAAGESPFSEANLGLVERLAELDYRRSGLAGAVDYVVDYERTAGAGQPVDTAARFRIVAIASGTLTVTDGDAEWVALPNDSSSDAAELSTRSPRVR